MPTLKYIFFILLVTLVCLFAVKNMHTVQVNLYDWTFADYSLQIPTMMVVLSSFGLGFLMAWFFELFTRLKHKATLHRQDRKIESLEEELRKLKPPPDPAPLPETTAPISEE
ncbi:MAG: LapA family protein [Nitrospinae bacterium]|nr:LapA family protein [Nitrospinota bacterium]